MRRYDVSQVPLQGAYVARHCPVRAQNDLLIPAEPVPATPFAEHLIDSGRRFEDAVLEELRRLHPGAFVAPRLFGEDLEAWTVAAMEAGAPLVLGARLPPDVEGRRTGRPDLLVRAEGGGYRAVEVKGHLTLDQRKAKSRKGPAVVSTLTTPWFESAAPLEGSSTRQHREDLLQLAHYQRMLEATGQAATDGRWAGVIGTEGQVVWRDLDEAILETPSSVPGQKKRRSTMEVYDHEFDFRLDVLAVGLAHEQDPSVELLVVPVKIPECERCPWWGRCSLELQDGHGDVSLVTPGVGWLQWKDHRERGVRDRHDLASLDSRTARLVTRAGVDVLALVTAAVDLPDGAWLGDLAEISEDDRSALEAEGVSTLGQLRGLCQKTAGYHGAPDSSGLAEQIDLARAALGPDAVYAKRGVTSVVVPRAEVEVDVDMENNLESRVYLWGTLLSTSSELNPPAYVAFDDFSAELTEEAEVALFSSFWGWFSGLRASALSQGKSFAAYCYNASAENQHLRRLAELAGLGDEVAEFVAGSEWVDVLKVVRTHLVTGSGLGLKDVAPAAGYRWVVDDPGGGESMVRYETATNPSLPETDRHEARAWLLTYNEGDVRATHALRNWIDQQGPRIKSVESMDPWSTGPGA